MLIHLSSPFATPLSRPIRCLLIQHPITVVLLIPNEKRVVGIVVGRHGLRLKTILSTSKCTITVEK